jgi:hypothetical protein
MVEKGGKLLVEKSFCDFYGDDCFFKTFSFFAELLKNWPPYTKFNLASTEKELKNIFLTSL